MRGHCLNDLDQKDFEADHVEPIGVPGTAFSLFRGANLGNPFVGRATEWSLKVTSDRDTSFSRSASQDSSARVLSLRRNASPHLSRPALELEYLRRRRYSRGLIDGCEVLGIG